MNLPLTGLYTRPGILIEIERKKAEETGRLRPEDQSLTGPRGRANVPGEERAMVLH